MNQTEKNFVFKRVKEINGNLLETLIAATPHAGLLRFDVVCRYDAFQMERVCYSPDKLLPTVEALEFCILRDHVDAKTYVEKLLSSHGFELAHETGTQK